MKVLIIGNYDNDAYRKISSPKRNHMKINI